MGDFNIRGSATGQGNCCYDDITNALARLGNVRDLWKVAHGLNVGYTIDYTQNTTVADDNERKRYDYIFVATDPTFTNSPFDIEIANPDDVKIVRWRIGFGALDHVSDHFGVEATIQIRERRP